jgi:hypothetical protein
MKNVNKALRVCHFPQVPCSPFIVEVQNEREAFLISETLATQHFWLFQNKFIPDYSNSIVIEMFETEEDLGWTSYWNEDEQMEWDEFESTYLTQSV